MDNSVPGLWAADPGAQTARQLSQGVSLPPWRVSASGEPTATLPSWSRQYGAFSGNAAEAESLNVLSALGLDQGGDAAIVLANHASEVVDILKQISAISRRQRRDLAELEQEKRRLLDQEVPLRDALAQAEAAARHSQAEAAMEREQRRAKESGSDAWQRVEAALRNELEEERQRNQTQRQEVKRMRQRFEEARQLLNEKEEALQRADRREQRNEARVAELSSQLDGMREAEERRQVSELIEAAARQVHILPHRNSSEELAARGGSWQPADSARRRLFSPSLMTSTSEPTPLEAEAAPGPADERQRWPFRESLVAAAVLVQSPRTRTRPVSEAKTPRAATAFVEGSPSALAGSGPCEDGKFAARRLSIVGRDSGALLVASPTLASPCQSRTSLLPLTPPMGAFRAARPEGSISPDARLSRSSAEPAGWEAPPRGCVAEKVIIFEQRCQTPGSTRFDVLQRPSLPEALRRGPWSQAVPTPLGNERRRDSDISPSKEAAGSDAGDWSLLMSSGSAEQDELACASFVAPSMAPRQAEDLEAVLGAESPLENLETPGVRHGALFRMSVYGSGGSPHWPSLPATGSPLTAPPVLEPLSPAVAASLAQVLMAARGEVRDL